MPTLTWTGKDEALRAASLVPFRLLEPHTAAEGGIVGDPKAAQDNLLIQGDNLEALKALLPYSAGRVKCIYIDPPYNTGSAFEHYDDNLEHSTWLSMMYPRLELLRELLEEEGSICSPYPDLYTYLPQRLQSHLGIHRCEREHKSRHHQADAGPVAGSGIGRDHPRYRRIQNRQGYTDHHASRYL